ncbi:MULTISPECIES: hypothetical protein [Anaerococcus]|nr:MULTISPECIES: hypothetical protein [Anaerococcus]MBP2069453.1 hypothetical protein [Anaerococcus nagyae]MDU2565774.1 hypothetical protein [Anaerococcus sp.]
MELIFNIKDVFICPLHAILAFIKKLKFPNKYVCHDIKESPV